MGHLPDSGDDLWKYAETHGVPDRLMVVIGCDCGRTNHYNVDGGKDHWPICGFVGMEKSLTSTNRVTGEPDERTGGGHGAAFESGKSGESVGGAPFGEKRSPGVAWPQAATVVTARPKSPSRETALLPDPILLRFPHLPSGAGPPPHAMTASANSRLLSEIVFSQAILQQIPPDATKEHSSAFVLVVCLFYGKAGMDIVIGRQTFIQSFGKIV